MDVNTAGHYRKISQLSSLLFMYIVWQEKMQSPWIPAGLMLFWGALATFTGQCRGQPALGEIYRLNGLQSDIQMDMFRYVGDLMEEQYRSLDRRLRGIGSRIRRAERDLGVNSPPDEPSGGPAFPNIPGEALV